MQTDTICFYNISCCAYIIREPANPFKPKGVPKGATLVHSYEVPRFLSKKVLRYFRSLLREEGNRAIWEMILDVPLFNKYILQAAIQCN